jgi:hypothetical protein
MLLFLLAACTQGGGGPNPANAVQLVVRNNYPADVEVMVVAEGGVPHHIGMVPVAQSRTFWVPAAFISPTGVRVIADPVGAGGVASSDPLIVHPGQTINFTVEPALSASTAVVM